MPQLMENGPIPVNTIVIGALGRHADIVRAGRVKGAFSPDTHIRAARLDETMRQRHNFLDIQRDGCGSQFIGQPFALLDIKNREAFEKRNLTRLAHLIPRSLFLVLRHKAISVADRRPLLAAPYMPTQRQRLPISQPALRAISFLKKTRPQDQHIYARIAAPGSRIARQADSRLAAVPRLHPRQAPLLQLRDDTIRHLYVERPMILTHIHFSLPSQHRPPERRGGRQEAHGGDGL